ncbi:GNAT family N-acetyltransferase [Spartinivicinus poritis]|uniref:GNAT family N-acetyltransferase n=1 Tax=Spartinivicinus poritis TaxID=2994640 RepID=A0ABT5UBC1_9GAMM|nr:GNAT family N-acetyltransferase [Spartinivicinus sp. A2-2]MDE1463673.1 GNAT family N-acetyltransferase [Spartinivicinus sp. A2-2]
MTTTKYYFETSRLLITEWHSIDNNPHLQINLADTIKKILTPSVTHSLPADWQNIHTDDHAKNWIKARDSEGVTLLIIEKQTNIPIGLFILTKDEDLSCEAALRIGYILEEPAWGKGFASELIEGFIVWCSHNKISLLTAGIDKGNIASKRVLEKNGFTCSLQNSSEDNLFFQYYINPK